MVTLLTTGLCYILKTEVLRPLLSKILWIPAISRLMMDSDISHGYCALHHRFLFPAVPVVPLTLMLAQV